MTRCTNQGCPDEATATVLVGATRLPKCFRHEREYADRFGPADIGPLPAEPPIDPTNPAGRWWREGRHSSGAAAAERMRLQYEGW